MNIPIYRAKKINSDEYIVSATIREDYKNDWKEKINGEWEDNKRDFLDMWVDKEKKWTEIDETTLAIHFPDMLDSQGNKIFASLSEDGKGGDMICDGDGYKVNFIFYKNSFQFRYIFNRKIGAKFIPSKIKVIGIQE